MHLKKYNFNNLLFRQTTLNAGNDAKIWVSLWLKEDHRDRLHLLQGMCKQISMKILQLVKLEYFNEIFIPKLDIKWQPGPGPEGEKSSLFLIEIQAESPNHQTTQIVKKGNSIYFKIFSNVEVGPRIGIFQFFTLFT